MLAVGGSQLQDRLAILARLSRVLAVQARASNADGSAQAPLESWFDLVQGG
jgi:hypothetical protein